jgi:hypothetical protein
MANSVSTLRDDFADGSIAATWITSETGSATAAETSGQARLTLPSSIVGSHVASWRSAAVYDLTGDSFYWNIGTMVSTSVAATALMDLRLSDNLNALRWTQTSGTLKAQTIVAGVATDRYSVAWNAATYKYLRIRESGGNVLFDSSSNGTAWTNRASVAAPFAVTELLVTFAVLCGNLASPGSLRLDDVNLILPALSTNWHWTQADWSINNRFRTVTISASSGQGYIATSSDGTTWQYFSGPMGSASGGYNALTLHSTQAAAEAMAVNLPGPANPRWDLPDITECRFIRLYHRSTTGSNYDLYEHYPRRLVQSDDIEAESIRAINIAAGAITADKIFVLELSAITANIGGLEINTDGYLWQGTGTAASPTTGLKIFNSGGIGKLSTYNMGVEQVTLDTDGKLKAGAGAIELSAAGAAIAAETVDVYNPASAISWFQSDGTTPVGKIWGAYTATRDRLVVEASADVSGDRGGTLSLSGEGTTGSNFALISVIGGRSAANSTVSLTASNGEILLNAPEIDASGSVAATVTDAATTARAYPLILNHSSSGTPGALFGTGIQMLGESSTTVDQPLAYMEARWASATHASRRSEVTFLTFDASSFRVPFTIGTTGSAPAVGFHGSTPIAKPTVTGSRGGNAALQSLLSALASYGLITDSSS